MLELNFMSSVADRLCAIFTTSEFLLFTIFIVGFTDFLREPQQTKIEGEKRKTNNRKTPTKIEIFGKIS